MEAQDSDESVQTINQQLLQFFQNIQSKDSSTKHNSNTQNVHTFLELYQYIQHIFQTNQYTQTADISQTLHLLFKTSAYLLIQNSYAQDLFRQKECLPWIVEFIKQQHVNSLLNYDIKRFAIMFAVNLVTSNHTNQNQYFDLIMEEFIAIFDFQNENDNVNPLLMKNILVLFHNLIATQSILANKFICSNNGRKVVGDIFVYLCEQSHQKNGQNQNQNASDQILEWFNLLFQKICSFESSLEESSFLYYFNLFTQKNDHNILIPILNLSNEKNSTQDNTPLLQIILPQYSFSYSPENEAQTTKIITSLNSYQYKIMEYLFQLISDYSPSELLKFSLSPSFQIIISIYTTIYELYSTQFIKGSILPFTTTSQQSIFKSFDYIQKNPLLCSDITLLSQLEQIGKIHNTHLESLKILIEFVDDVTTSLYAVEKYVIMADTLQILEHCFNVLEIFEYVFGELGIKECGDVVFNESEGIVKDINVKQIVGYSTKIMKTVSNLAYHNPYAFKYFVQNNKALGVVLSKTGTNFHEVTMREWAIFTIRHLCEGSQDIIDILSNLKLNNVIIDPAVRSILEKSGVEVVQDQDNIGFVKKK